MSEGVRRTVLPGGLRVVTEAMPAVRSASVGLWLGVGSRDEHPKVAGAAHFLEHLLFKSTPTRSALDIAQQIDGVGGELNAFTGKESTCYYAQVIDTDLPLAMDLVTDVVLNGQCRDADVELERQVVLEELAMRDDDPEDLVAELLLSAVFGAHPLGRPIIGTAERVQHMSGAQLRSFHRRRYTPERTVISVAGNVRHEDVLELVTKAYGERLSGDATPTPRRAGALRIPRHSGLGFARTDGEQAQFMMGVRTMSRHDDDRWALSVLNAALGGGLSSRLFQEIREERGLAYSAYSTLDTFADAGVLSVYAGCSPENLAQVVTVTREVLANVASHGITDAETARAKGSLRGSLVLGLEETGARMNRIGRHELNYGGHLSIPETLSRIDDVTTEQVNAVARRVLRRRPVAAVVGPYARRSALPKVVRELAG